MSELTKNSSGFVGYEYKEMTVNREIESMYTDGYENFGWKVESVSPAPITGINAVSMKFKRDRKIQNKTELTRLQHQFDACISEITGMEKSKTSTASITAFTIGLLGTALMAGATFSYLGGLLVFCIVLAVPGFLGWILPYFLYKSVYAKKTAKVAPLIDNKYDEIYEVCERASGLLGN